MQTELKIGLVGLDTSHVTAFTKLLNDASAEYSVSGGKVIAAFPGGSPDFPLSINRVDGFTQDLKANYGVEILDSPEAVAEKCDAIMLTAVDGRAHPELFARLAPFKKPIFVDKPFAISSHDAQQMVAAAREYSTPLMSCSSLRYAEPVAEALAAVGREAIISVDATGPMALEATQNNIYWYGIHSVEVLFAAMGAGCVSVQAAQSDDYELLTGVWSDDRVASVRGDHAAQFKFSLTLYCDGSSRFVDAYNHAKPPYAGLLEQLIPFFQTGESPIDIEETLQITRFIEAANESREAGKPVAL
jgi:predicted dehydrogenase